MSGDSRAGAAGRGGRALPSTASRTGGRASPWRRTRVGGAQPSGSERSEAAVSEAEPQVRKQKGPGIGPGWGGRAAGFHRRRTAGTDGVRGHGPHGRRHQGRRGRDPGMDAGDADSRRVDTRGTVCFSSAALGGSDEPPGTGLPGPEPQTAKPPHCPSRPPSRVEDQHPARLSTPHPCGRVASRGSPWPPATTMPGPARGLHLDLLRKDDTCFSPSVWKSNTQLSETDSSH